MNRIIAGALALALSSSPIWAQTHIDSNGTIIQGVAPINPPVGALNFTAAQPTIATTSTLVIAARTGTIGSGRVALTLVNQCSQDAFLGPTLGVTTLNGGRLKAGASLTLNTTAAIYGVVATGTCEIDPWETY